MTTLPQTTPMRLPRPTGATPIAIPSAGGPIAPPAVPPGMIQMTGADVWRVLRSNWWLIAGMVVAMGVAGVFVNKYLAKHHPRFTAVGLLNVQLPEEAFSQKSEDAVANPQSIELEQKTQARGLMQAGLMLDVLTNSPAVRETEWYKQFKGPEEAKEDLLSNFSAQPIAESRLIQVEMSYRVPRDARAVVEAVVERYIRKEQERASAAWSGKARGLEEQLEQDRYEYKKVTQQLTSTSTNVASDSLVQLYGQLGNKQYEMTRLTDSRQAAEKELNEAKNAFESMTRLVEGGEAPAEVEARILENPSFSEYQRQIDAMDIAIAQLSGTNSPRAQNLLRQRQTFEQKRDDLRETLRAAYVGALRAEIQTKMDAAKQALDLADARLAEVGRELTDIQSAASTYREAEQKQKTLKEKMDEVERELAKIQHRKLPSGWSPVTWFASPATPDKPTFPNLVATLAVAVMLGLALSVGIAFLREVTDTSIRSPRDIARVGQMNLLGMIPHQSDDPQAAGARLPLVIFDAPHSMAAEEFRKLRTRLQHAASLDSTRSILVSSANPGDGKTTVACNLAAGLALNGRRILLVDANFRRPEIHNLFDVPNDHGFSDVLNSLAYFDTAIRDTPVQNLFVMPTGPKPVNATELLESQLLIDFIERALEDFDHVIFDSGPLLIVSETMALAPRVDGVVSVVRARSNSRGVLQRMRDVLRQVKSEHLGVVLNAVRSQGGGYYGSHIKTYYAYQNG
jgi:capsular exopolysaccharide synthesis family protein